MLLCGSGTTGCHGWVHGHPREAYRLGLLVHSWHEPATVPVFGRQGWALLDGDGKATAMTMHDAHAAMTALGLGE